MNHSLRRALVLVSPFVVALGCQPSNRETVASDPAPGARLMVTADTTVIEPTATVEPHDGLGRLGVTEVQNTYRVTTPAGEPFSFDVVGWQPGTAGEAKLAVAHVRDGETFPTDASSLAAAGIVVTGRGLVTRTPWFESNGDGLVRMNVHGRISADQTIAVETGDGSTIVLDIDVGPRSVINRPSAENPDDDGVVSRQTIYSSDSPLFGLPTVAVSGDRTSIVCYEGDRGVEQQQRYEMRLQHDAVTQAVTGGGSVSMSADTGFWRDHEIAALHNVLAVVRSESDGVKVRLSYDRGATFAQDVTLGAEIAQSRLVQVAMAADYSLAIAFWKANVPGQSLHLTLVEGSPVAFDGTGSPTWFQFGAPQTIHTEPLDATPLTTGIAWSEGGDLVIGYGATRFEVTIGFGWRSITEFRCAVRHYGEAIEDRFVDEEEIFGMDPTVAVLGSGDAMRIFYAYEVRAGIRLAVSDDGGASFVKTGAFGAQGDHLPSVFARMVGGETRVDVLYLAPRAEGRELHRTRWTNWPSSPREDQRLTHASLQGVAADPILMPPGMTTMKNTQIGMLGYDAVLDGDRLVVAYDEETTELTWWVGPIWVPGTALSGMPTSTTFTPAVPPPLAPGMTESVPPVDAAHAHQLVLMRLQ